MNLPINTNQNKDLSVWIQEAQSTHLSDVFSAENLPYVASFGGSTLAENAKKAELAILNCVETERIWNRAHSQWTWKHINLSYAAPFKNLRQVSAEVSAKREALDSAKWTWLKAQAQIKIKEQEILEETNIYKRDLLEIELAELKAQTASNIKYVEGAMKDVIILSELYNQLKSQYENYTEEDFEREEAKSHLKRSLVQCLRDIRQLGRITKGEQEYLEQIGVNPGKIYHDMINYLAEEERSNDYSIVGMYKFLDDMCNKLIDTLQVDKTRLQLQGLKYDLISEALYAPSKQLQGD